MRKKTGETALRTWVRLKKLPDLLLQEKHLGEKKKLVAEC